MTNVHATRGSHFRQNLLSRFSLYGFLFGIAVCLALAVARHSNDAMLVGAPIVAALILARSWHRASEDAEADFFRSFAPELGLQYMVSGSLPPITPLLSAGDSRECEHVMEGPLFGRRGGPTCTLAHYTFKTSEAGSEGGTRTVSHPFTVAAMEIEEALPVFHGVYLRRRPAIRIGFLWDDWLARAHAEAVDLESADFEELYELRAARDQDRSVLYELFSPSFVVWLAEHPLRPGFECKAGTLAVFVPEHQGDADRLTLFHEASREIARRVTAAVDAQRSVSPAG